VNKFKAESQNLSRGKEDNHYIPRS